MASGFVNLLVFDRTEWVNTDPDLDCGFKWYDGSSVMSYRPSLSSSESRELAQERDRRKTRWFYRDIARDWLDWARQKGIQW